MAKKPVVVEKDLTFQEIVAGTDVTRNVRTVSPVLLVGLGGTGAEILRRVKARVHSLGIADFCRFLIVDLDYHAKSSTPGRPAFEDSEFCYLPRAGIRTILKHPADHENLAERFDFLKDDEVRGRLATIAARSEEGAGQVRALGLLGLWANYTAFHNQLSSAVTELTGKWKSLKERLKTEDPELWSVASGVDVYLVGSVCGGTGSSMIVDVAVALHQALGTLESTITAILAMPDVFEKSTQGTIGEWFRMKANAYATLTEIDYFQTGLAASQNVLVGMHDGQPLPVPPSLFSYTYLVERRDQEGKDLGSDEAVFDTVALAVLAGIGTTIGGKQKAKVANDAACAGLAPCPRSGKGRLYSTLGASSLSIPVWRILEYCCYRQAYEVVRDTLLGPVPQAEEVRSDVARWLESVKYNERMSADQVNAGVDAVSGRLRSLVVPNTDPFVRPLYKLKSDRDSQYFGDREFVARFVERLAKWSPTDLSAIANALDSKGMQMIEAFIPEASGKSAILEKQLNAVLGTKGLRYAYAFVGEMLAFCKAAAAELKRSAAASAQEASKARAVTQQHLKPIQSFWGKFGSDPRAQELLIQDFATTVRKDVLSEILKAAQRVFDGITVRVAPQLASLAQSIETYMQLETYLAERKDEKVPMELTTIGESKADLDATTSDFMIEFYTLNRLSTAQFLEEFAKRNRESLLQYQQDSSSATVLCRELLCTAYSRFAPRMNLENVADVLVKELARDERSASIAMTRFSEGIKACRPLWQADTGVADCFFSDSVVVGVPATGDVQAKFDASAFQAAIPNIQAEMNRDPLYQARLDVCLTADPHRIYAVRRSHGGLPFYLARWDSYRAAYVKWQQNPAHPVHVFSSAIIDKIPSMEPLSGESENKMIFALALALGWIAVRGKFYYFNLEQVPGQNLHEMLYNSTWDCIPFADGKLREPMGPFQKLIDEGLLRFCQKGRPEPGRRMGDDGGRKDAFKVLSQQPAAIKKVRDLFEEARTILGDTDLSAAIEKYVQDVRGRVGSGENYALIQEEMKLLLLRLESMRRR